MSDNEAVEVERVVWEGAPPWAYPGARWQLRIESTDYGMPIAYWWRKDGDGEWTRDPLRPGAHVVYIADLLAAEKKARQAERALWLEYVQLLAVDLSGAPLTVARVGAGIRLRAALGLDPANHPADNARAEGLAE